MCWSYGNFRNAGEGSGLFWSYHHLGGFPEYVFPSTRVCAGSKDLYHGLQGDQDAPVVFHPYFRPSVSLEYRR